MAPKAGAKAGKSGGDELTRDLDGFLTEEGDARPAEQGEEVLPSSAGVTRFSDFNLKEPLMNAIVDNGFESPSDVQTLAIPYALERRDLICQAKSGKGKTAVFVLSILQLLDPSAAPGQVQCLVLSNTHEMALQIAEEFERFSKYIPGLKDRTMRAYGGIPKHLQIAQLKLRNQEAGAAEAETQDLRAPVIVVGTVGRVTDLVESGDLDLSNVRHFVVDEFDDILHGEKTGPAVSEISAKLPAGHQTMLFTATLSADSEEACRRLLRDGFKRLAVDDAELVLTGLVQRYLNCREDQKIPILMDMLQELSYTQGVIFVSSPQRAASLAKYLASHNFQCESFSGRMRQDKREELYRRLKSKDVRLVVSTDIFQRGVDFESMNLVIHFDMPKSADAYLHRSGRAGRFETAGLVVSFVGSEDDQTVLGDIQSKFVVDIPQIAGAADIDQKQCFISK